MSDIFLLMLRSLAFLVSIISFSLDFLGRVVRSFFENLCNSLRQLLLTVVSTADSHFIVFFHRNVVLQLSRISTGISLLKGPLLLQANMLETGQSSCERAHGKSEQTQKHLQILRYDLKGLFFLTSLDWCSLI